MTLTSGEPVHHAYRDLDRALGPLVPGSLTSLVAGRGAGKTAFALDLCRSAAIRQRKTCLFVTTRMSAREVGERLVTAEARVPYEDLLARSLGRGKRPEVGVAADALRTAGLGILESPLDVFDLVSSVGHAQMRRPIDLLVVDDADTLRPDESSYSDLPVALLRLSRQLDIPVLATGAIAGAAAPPDFQTVWGAAGEGSVVTSLILCRPDAHGPSATPGEAFLYVMRPGRGVLVDHLSFDARYGRMTSMAPGVSDVNTNDLLDNL